MIGKVAVKRAVKRAAGCAAVLGDALSWGVRPQHACILCYHRVAEVGFRDKQYDDWNVPPERFERQMAALSGQVEFVPLLEVHRRLATGPATDKPLVCVTFDDGYANIIVHALPVLRRYGIPATIFVVTSLVGTCEPPPFDAWSLRNRGRATAGAWRPASWQELETAVASGLVTVGSHSHRHRKGTQSTAAQLVEEAEESRAALLRRLGSDHASAYAYPYGTTRLGFVGEDYVHAVRAGGYEAAVTTDLGLATAQSDPYRLPRIEAHAVDGPRVIRAKVRGALAPYYWTDRFRSRHRPI
jgi:peptidoglycan/xylan/chitin deacetylase (PgdA/CDA1 family)